MEFITFVFKLFAALAIILPLIYIVLKFGGTNLQRLQNGKYIKIYEKVALSKENQILVMKLGEKGYVLSSSNGRIDILKDIDEEEMNRIEESHKIHEYTNYKDLLKAILKKKGDSNV
jgi:flagellar protein FliO/FliZ